MLQGAETISITVEHIEINGVLMVHGVEVMLRQVQMGQKGYMPEPPMSKPKGEPMLASRKMSMTVWSSGV